MAIQAEWVEKDLYAVLGVAQDADAKAIKRAYRKLARDLHPDTHPDDPQAAEKFKAVTAAYDVIGDEAKRSEYDDFRRAVASAGGSGRTGGTGGGFDGGFFSSGDGGRRSRFHAGSATGEAGEWDGFENTTWTTFDGDDLGDLLGGLFGGRAGHAGASTGPRRGPDLEAVLDLAFEDAIRGVTTDVTLRDPDGARTFKVRGARRRGRWPADSAGGQGRVGRQRRPARRPVRRGPGGAPPGVRPTRAGPDGGRVCHLAAGRSRCRHRRAHLRGPRGAGPGARGHAARADASGARSWGAQLWRHR